MEPFPIPGATATTEQVLKQSRFICHLGHADTITSAEEQIRAIRQQHPQANHTCWAFIAGPPDSSRKGMSDDGEPKGTAGRPMLSVLEYSGMGEVWTTVTRYFGGIKLGTGGLVRAYSSSVQKTLHSVEKKLKQTLVRCSLIIDYRLLNSVEKHLADCTSEIIDKTYGEEVELIVLIPQNRMIQLQAWLRDISSGRTCLSEL